MAQRLIEVIVPSELTTAVRDKLLAAGVKEIWVGAEAGAFGQVRLLTPTEQSEEILDLLEAEITGREGARIILLPVEATLPRLPEPEEEEKPEQPEQPKKKKMIGRISREELYTDISATTKVNGQFAMWVALSSVIAMVGLIKSSPAIIIGAMVVAPMLGPNMAAALATTLGDLKLGIKAVKANGLGAAVSLAMAVGFGLFWDFSKAPSEMESRTVVELGDILLALAAGVAGTMGFTSAATTSLVGVMVAVALLPPWVTFGMYLGDGQLDKAMGAFVLLATNVTCLNLAGVLTFRIQGVRPRTWWEADRASAATRNAIILWLAILAILTTLIVVQGEYFSLGLKQR